MENRPGKSPRIGNWQLKHMETGLAKQLAAELAAVLTGIVVAAKL